MVEWRVYGCGSASSNKSLQSSYEFIDNQSRLNIDFGNGAIYRRCQSETDIFAFMNSMKHLFLTHGHPDHTVDLTRLIVCWKYTPGYTPERKINLYGTPKSLDEVKTMLENIGIPGTYEDTFDIHPIEPETQFQIETLDIHTIPSHHIEGAIGLRIHTPCGAQVAFTGDTGVYEGQVDYLQDLDLLVIEASYHNHELFMHLNLHQVAKIARDCNPKAIALVHFYPDVEAMTLDEIRAVIQPSYSGDIYACYDGLSLKWNQTTNQWTESKLF
jgi:ribonuclease BN (tRNA processing enzyme)